MVMSICFRLLSKLISVIARNGGHISSDNPPENIVRLPPGSPSVKWSSGAQVSSVGPEDK